LNQIAFPKSSLVLKITLDLENKAYYLAFYNSDLVFYLFDISNFNQIDKDHSDLAVYMTSLDMRGVWPFKYKYTGCSGLYYEKETFYSICWDAQKDYYVAKIKATNLNDTTHSNPVKLSPRSSGRLKTTIRNLSNFDVAFNKYIISVNESFADLFMVTEFVKNKETPTRKDFIYGIMEQIENSMGDFTENDISLTFSIGSMAFQDKYLFFTDTNYGIFVVEIQETEEEDSLVAVDCYLYALTSGPNEIHIEKINDNFYQLVVTTTLQNDVLVFEQIRYGTDIPVSSILKLNRIHAF
jgi:hypothetical protein